MANPLAVAARSLVRSSAVSQKDLQIFYDRATIPQTIGRSSTSGLQSNVLMSPVMWVMRAFTEAMLIVQRREVDAGGGLLWHRSLDHDVELLVRRPNPYYTADALWKATALSYVIDGNAYWQKIRNPLGEVMRLWYIPHWMIRPVRPFDGRTYLSNYELSMGSNGPQQLAPRDVVHFRFGLDPVDTLLGYSPLKAILREVLTDDEAARFSEKILENMGVPGMIVSPQKDSGFKPDEAQVKRLQAYFDNAFKGDRRGQALVLGGPTDVAQFGFDPNKLMLPNLRDISEERVCAALGIPSAVVGFGSGLQSTKVGATMRELVKLARVQCLNPMFWTFGETVTDQLMTDFVGDKFKQTFRCRFDVSEVSAFQEDAKAEAERITMLVREKVLRIDRAQQALGLEVDTSRAKYIDEVEADATPEPAPPPPLDDTSEPDEPEPADEETEKALLRAIAKRNGFLAHTNGNGKHP